MKTLAFEKNQQVCQFVLRAPGYQHLVEESRQELKEDPFDAVRITTTNRYEGTVIGNDIGLKIDHIIPYFLKQNKSFRTFLNRIKCISSDGNITAEVKPIQL